MEKAKKAKTLEEQNSATNQNLKKIIEQNDLKIKQSEEQIKLLEVQNDNLKEQLKRAIENEKVAKKRQSIIEFGLIFLHLLRLLL